MPRRNNRNDVIFFLSLLIRLYSLYQQLPYKPPATIAIALFLIVIYILEDYYLFIDLSWALCPYLVLHPGSISDVMRVVKFHIVHLDSYHLYYNVSSLLWKGSHLEVAMGSKAFILLTLFLMIVSGILFVFFAWVLSSLNLYSASYYDYTLGYSCILFGYKFIYHSYHTPSHYALVTWFELVYMSLFPGVSLLGHLSGILAGYLYIQIISRFPGLNLGSFASYEGVHSFRSQSKTDTRSYEEDECTALNEELRRRESWQQQNQFERSY